MITSDRILTERNIWFATVRPDGRPHLIPIWFVVHEQAYYICTAPGSVKAHNIAHDARVTLALEDGDKPFVIEGEASPVEPPTDVIAAFKSKYDWDITTDEHYTQTYRIDVRRQVAE